MRLFYRKDRDMFRVWREDWSGDTFEVLNAQDFFTLQLLLNRFGIPCVEADEDA